MLQPGGIWMILDASKFQCFKMLVLLPRTLNATIVIRPDGLLPALRGRGPCIWPDSGCLPALRHGGVGAKGEPVANSHGFWFGCDIKQIEKVARLTYCFHFFRRAFTVFLAKLMQITLGTSHEYVIPNANSVCCGVTMNSFYRISDILIGFSNSISIWLVVSNIFYFP